MLSVLLITSKIASITAFVISIIAAIVAFIITWLVFKCFMLPRKFWAQSRYFIFFLKDDIAGVAAFFILF